MTKRGSVRVVCLSSMENKVDDYLATHIPEEVMSHEEIGEAYRPEVLNVNERVEKGD